MTQRELSGIVVPIITPIDEQDRVDEAGFRKVIRHLINAGVHGLFIGGSAGEGPLLTLAEWTRMIEIAQDEANGEIPLLGGAMETSSTRIAERLHVLAATGYQYYVVNPVFYISHTQPEEHLQLFADCKAHDQGMELVAYNIPVYSRCEIPVEVLVEAGRRCWIRYCKDSSCDPVYLQRLLDEGAPVGLKVLTGDEFQLVEGVRAGAVGAVPVCANYEPATFVRAYEMAHDADKTIADEAQARIKALRHNLIETDGCWLAGVKYAMSQIGMGSGRLVSPIQQLTAEGQQKIDNFMRESSTTKPVLEQA